MSTIMINVIWNPPESTPHVPLGKEQLFWLAVKSVGIDGKATTTVRLAHYQNRPLSLDDNGEPLDDDCLTDLNGDPMSSVGWVGQFEHDDFSDFYRPIEFNERYVLLAWAAFETPIFKGVSSACPDCDNGKGKCKFPFEAPPPNYPNTLVIKDKEDWPSNFELMPFSDLGVYKYCNCCGRPSNYGKNDEPS